jgi:hypothetical protein
VSVSHTATADPEPDTAINGGVDRVDPTGDARWDADLAACPGATFFHGAAWAGVLKESYGFTPTYFAQRDSAGLRSLLPLMEVDSWLTGRRGVALPFTDECPPLSAGPESFRRLHRAALDHAGTRRWKYLEFRGGRTLFGEVPASAAFLGHSLDLSRPEGELFAGFDSSVRRAIRKAEQGGLTIQFSQDIEAVRAFHGLLLKTRKRHGVPPQPFHFFASIHRHVLARNKGWVVLARLGGVPVAGAMYFHFGHKVIYKYGASDEAFQHLRANNLVMWRAIARYAGEGYTLLDFGRTAMENKGLRKFKLDWGSVERRVEYARFDRREGSFVVPGEALSGWQIRLFKVLPDWLFQWIGSALYRHAA